MSTSTRVDLPHIERFRRKAAIGAIFATILFVLLALAPFALDQGITTDWVKLFYLISLASMWNLLAGYAGMVSVGQQAFIGLGAYGVFVFNDMGVNAYMSGIIASVIVGIIAFPLSFLAFRLRGGYFAIGTWVIAETVRLIVIRFANLGAGKGRSVANYTSDPGQRNDYTYWMALAVLVFALAASFTLLRTRLGLALQSIRDNEVAATSVGVNVNRVKRIVYVLAATGCAGAGAVICVQAIGVASPTQIFGVSYSAFMIFMVLIGGLGTIEGPVIGAFIYFMMDKYFSQQGLWYLVALGLVAIVVTLFFPKGIWGEINARWKISLFPVGYQVMDKKTHLTNQEENHMSLLDPTTWSGKIFNGQWTVGGGGTQEITEPATGGSLGTIGIASVKDVEVAAKSAAKAQIAWAARKPEERAAILRRAGDLWNTHAEEIQGWIMRETGAIPPKAGLETHLASEICFESSGLPSHPNGSVLPSGDPHWSFSRRRPAGVVSVISPFNFPLILSIRSVAPALALGNAVLLKPDPRTTMTGGISIVRIFQEAGLPEGLLHLLPGGVEIGEAIITAPEVRIISFTGSTPAGRKVGELGARHLKRVHLELGGNNAMVVLPGADLALAASAAAFGSFLHQGQICMTTGRHIVHESLYDEFVKLLGEKASHLPVGNPATDQVALGPIIDSKQLSRVDDLVKRTVAAGATLVAGGTYEGLFYRPTVLANVKSDMPAYAEEVFGPVAPVISYSTIEEAIALASGNSYGLSLSILGDVGMAMRIADSVPSGIIHINEMTVGDEANVPFGGVGESGNGSRFGGAEANLEAFTEMQWLTVRSEIAPYPF